MSKALFFLSFLLFSQLWGNDKPNVVIFFTDDQGTLDVNAYGAKDLYTPNMDRLANEGVKFTQAYAHTVCCPSRAMLMTGRYPQRSGIVSWTQGDRKGAETVNLPKNEITIAEYLKQGGYQTGLFGKWHLGAKDGHGPLDQGFDSFYGHLGGFIDNYNHYFLHQKGFHDLYDQKEEIFKKGEYFPDLMTKRAVQFIDDHKSQPFFMMVSFNIPHYPEQADSKFDERYKHLPMPRQSYAKMISTTDDRIGWVMKALDQHKITDKTMIIFMSDNGHSEENKRGISVNQHKSGLPKGHYYSAHGGGGYTGKWIGKKGTFLEGGLRVPAMIRYPKLFKAGTHCDKVITACDWLPTILEACSVLANKNSPLDGQSLIPLIQQDTPSHYNTLHWGWQKNWAIRQGPWKLIRQNKKLSLLNLEDAKPEEKNYANEKPELVSQLESLHSKWLDRVTP